MVVNGPPCTVRIAGDADEFSACAVLAPAGGAGAGLDHEARLGTYGPDSLLRVVIFDLPQEPVGEDLALRVLLRGGGLIGVGGQNFPSQLVVHGGT